MVVDLLAKELGIRLGKSFFSNFLYSRGGYRGNNISLVKPLTYMNRSGEILNKLLCKKGVSPDNMVVVLDSMDLHPGVVRFKKKGGGAGHNGLQSLLDYYDGSDELKRFYVGIGRPEDPSEVVQYVLGVPSGDELLKIEKGIRIAAQGILMLAETSPDQVMNEINRIKNRPDN